MAQAPYNEMVRALRDLYADDAGETAVEYALIAAAIAGLVLTVVFAFGGKVKNYFNNVSRAMP